MCYIFILEVKLILKGKVHKYGANVNTDDIIPARYLNMSAPEDLARHTMEGIDTEFVKKIKPGDIIVAETNFGCGSSREHAPLAIKSAGISCVISSSFARIFFRNGINIGLPLLESPEAVSETDDGDIVEVELDSGEITNITKKKIFKAKAYPDFMMGIVNAGGLVEYTRTKISGGK
jgi:3-isopropylmalate/(R)-2-methylmalate dehydratase small subunit